MKRLLLILILTFSFQTWTMAEDITDLEIEGISIGESLLEFMNIKDIEKQLIENDYLYSYTDKKFISIVVTGIKSDLYDKRIIVEVKRKNDLKYIIYSVRGEMIFPGMTKCLTSKKNIITDIQSTFNNIKKEDWVRDFPGYSDNKYKIHGTNFNFNSGDSIVIICSQFPRDVKPKRPDSFYVSIRLKEFHDWLGQY